MDSQSEESEMRQLKARITALEDGNRLLREMVDKMTALLQTKIQVNVMPHTPLAPLGVFTGSRPTGGDEVDFAQWEEQVDVLMRGNDSPSDVLASVRRSLRGVAWELAKSCSSAKDIVSRLSDVFGCVRTPVELLAEFLKTEMDRSDSPSDFLAHIWLKFIRLNKSDLYSDTECSRNVYFVYMKSLMLLEPMMARELKIQFGRPGSALPDLTSLLKSVRQVEVSSSVPAEVGRAHQEQSEAINYKELAGMVAERLRGHSKPQKPKGPCYRCKSVGHLVRDCPVKSGSARRNKKLKSTEVDKSVSQQGVFVKPEDASHGNNPGRYIPPHRRGCGSGQGSVHKVPSEEVEARDGSSGSNHHDRNSSFPHHFRRKWCRGKYSSSSFPHKQERSGCDQRADCSKPFPNSWWNTLKGSSDKNLERRGQRSSLSSVGRPGCENSFPEKSKWKPVPAPWKSVLQGEPVNVQVPDLTDRFDVVPVQPEQLQDQRDRGRKLQNVLLEVL